MPLPPWNAPALAAILTSVMWIIAIPGSVRRSSHVISFPMGTRKIDQRPLNRWKAVGPGLTCASPTRTAWKRLAMGCCQSRLHCWSLKSCGDHEPGHLLDTLLAQWPNYVAFLLSFFYAGVIWLNHRAVFARVRFSDRSLHLANCSFCWSLL